MNQSYLSPPEFIIYCKYIAMYQWDIPLTIENLKSKNKELPFPKLNVGLDAPKNNTIFENRSEVKENSLDINYNPSVIQVTSITHPSDSVAKSFEPDQDDDFDDFVGPNTSILEPPKELTEEESKQIEEDEKQK